MRQYFEKQLEGPIKIKVEQLWGQTYKDLEEGDRIVYYFIQYERPEQAPEPEVLSYIAEKNIDTLSDLIFLHYKDGGHIPVFKEAN